MPPCTISKPRLLIHIGMHKTGSTSLQRFFVRNRMILRIFRIDYPPSYNSEGRRLPKHNDLFHAISHEKDHGKAHPILGSSASRIAALARRASQHRITVLSAEGLSGESSLFAEAFAPLKDKFDVRIVCYLRRQDHWVQSFYKQMVQSREVKESRPFEAFIRATSTQNHLNYAQMLDWWSTCLGPAAIRVIIYNPQIEVVPEFLRATDLSTSIAKLPFSKGVQNRSPVSDHVERIRRANAAQLERPLPQPADEEHHYFSDVDRSKFLAQFEAGNDSIRRRFRPDLTHLFDDNITSGLPLPPR